MDILKGFIIGIGKIIPGVSGSVLAISMGIYDRIIKSISHFFSDIKSNSIFLSKVGIGMIIAISFFSNIIVYLLENYYLITIFIFSGLIIGSMDNIKKNIDNKDLYICFIIFTTFSLFGINNVNNTLIVNNNLLHFLLFILIGFIDALTMIIPGISGTAILMMIGVYKELLISLSNIFSNISTIMPFGIGISIGIIFTVKLVDYLFNNYKSKTYSAILGFSYSSIVIMIIKGLNKINSFNDIFISIIFFLISIFLVKKINRLFSID